jgi:hypothetical protein
MKISLIVLSSLLIALAVGQLDNNPPVPGRFSGLTFGSNSTGIWMEAILDPVCDGCAFQWPIFTEFLDSPWLGKKVKDFI